MNIKDIAKICGVSTATVSRVLNNSSSVKESTRQEVLRVIEEYDYIPSNIARNLHQKYTKNIGVVVADISNEFFSSAIRGITKITDKNDYQVLFFNTDESLDKEAAVLDTVFEERLSGLIISPVSSKNNKTYEKLVKLNEKLDIPVVFLDRNIDGLKFDSVFVDNRLASKEAVQALIDKGHKRIAVITGPRTSMPGRNRYYGYVDALKENDIKIDDKYVISSDFKTDLAYEKMKDLMTLKNPPTAIFACNNLTSLGCLKYFTEFGYKIGTDISIIGFDAINSLKIVNFPFSYIDRDAEDQGKIAAELLLKRITSREKSSKNIRAENIYIGHELCLRGSENLDWENSKLINKDI